MPDQQEVNWPDLIVAVNLVMKVEHLMNAMTLIAQSLGTTITIVQVLSAVLVQGVPMSDRVIKRDEFMAVYDHVHAATAQAWAAESPQQPEPSGPEATAHAATTEKAGQLAEHWGNKITAAAFGFEVPGSEGSDG